MVQREKDLKVRENDDVLCGQEVTRVETHGCVVEIQLSKTDTSAVGLGDGTRWTRPIGEDGRGSTKGSLRDETRGPHLWY